MLVSIPNQSMSRIQSNEDVDGLVKEELGTLLSLNQ
jgi:hypothetical protein